MGVIVVGVDGSRAAGRALRWAVREAELHGAGVELVHCYLDADHGAGVGRQRAQATLRQVVDDNRVVLDRVAWSGTAVAASSVPSAGLIAAAEDADMLVLGTAGAGGDQRLRLGSTAYRTAVHAVVPIAVIPIDGELESSDARRRIVVGVDDSAVARRALGWAVREARLRGVELVAVHAELPDDARPRRSLRSPVRARGTAPRRRGGLAVEHQPEDLAGRDDLAVDPITVPGSPQQVLLEWAADDRLLVVGARGRQTEQQPAFGSVSHHCIHHATGPVVVVP